MSEFTNTFRCRRNVPVSSQTLRYKADWLRCRSSSAARTVCAEIESCAAPAQYVRNGPGTCIVMVGARPIMYDEAYHWRLGSCNRFAFRFAFPFRFLLVRTFLGRRHRLVAPIAECSRLGGNPGSGNSGSRRDAPRTLDLPGLRVGRLHGHMGLAPRTAHIEIKRYTPSVSELYAPTMARPWFISQPIQNSCPYCGSASSFFRVAGQNQHRSRSRRPRLASRSLAPLSEPQGTKNRLAGGVRPDPLNPPFAPGERLGSR